MKQKWILIAVFQINQLFQPQKNNELGGKESHYFNLGRKELHLDEAIIETRRLGNVRSHIKFRPAHLHFSLNCLPNEDEIKKLTYQQIVQQTTKRSKKNLLSRAYETCDYHNMTTRKDGSKNQIVSNINYDQNSLSIF